MLFIIVQKAFGRYYNAPKTGIMSFMRQTLTTMLGKTVKKAAQIRGGSGSALPGLVIEKIDSDFVSRTLQQLPMGVALVSGTNGKTTTKELLSAVLAEKYNVMHTEGNFNNDIGVPKTLLRLAPEHQIAVIEMGASHPGDIKKLVEYAEPTCGLITNVGRAHLQGFGSFEGVKRTKGELYDFLKAQTRSLFSTQATAIWLKWHACASLNA